MPGTITRRGSILGSSGRSSTGRPRAYCVFLGGHLGVLGDI